MANDNNDKPDPTIGKVDGKTTPFGFDVRLAKPIPRNTFLSTYHENKNYVLSVANVWNSEKGSFANVKVVGEVPLTPFKMDSNILIADKDQIIDALGLNIDQQQSLRLGKILHTDIDANINIEKMGRVFITGRSGSGKSYTVGVLIEELMKKQVPLIIIDRHGEYSSLKILEKNNIPDEEHFFDKDDPKREYAEHIIEFGDENINPWVDLDIEYLIASRMKDAVRPGNAIIINLRGLDIPIQENVIEQVCARLYKASTLGDIPPHYIFIDEAHLFAGKKKKPIRKTLKLLAQEGRKFGSNLVLITQKPQALDTTIRAQAGTWIIHKLSDVNDVRITSNSAEGLGSESQDEIQNLSPGEAIVTGDIAPHCPIMTKVRLRYTVHGGAGYNVLDHLREGEEIPKAKLVQNLKKQISQQQKTQMSQDVLSSDQLTPVELQHRLTSLKEQNIKLKQEISDLKAELQKMEEVTAETQFIGKRTKNVDDKIEQAANVFAGNSPDNIMNESQFKDKIEDLEAEIQTLELEKSGLKVEVNDLKDKFKKEQKRADDAINLAEKLMKKLKNQKK